MSQSHTASVITSCSATMRNSPLQCYRRSQIHVASPSQLPAVPLTITMPVVHITPSAALWHTALHSANSIVPHNLLRCHNGSHISAASHDTTTSFSATLQPPWNHITSQLPSVPHNLTASFNARCYNFPVSFGAKRYNFP